MTASVRIGDPVLRIEDERLLRGQGRFIDDVDCGPAPLHAWFVRSPHAHARVLGIDLDTARAMPGVLAILTAGDLVGTRPIAADFARPGFQVTERPLLAVDRVRFVGDAVALVIAADPYQALDAAEAVEVDYAPLPPVIGALAAIAPDAGRVHDAAPGNVLFESAFATEGFDALHGAAPYRLSADFAAGRVAALSIEPRGCAARLDRDSGQLTVWSSTQVPHMLMTCLAEHLGLREADLRVIAPDVGGGFGMKAAVYPEELLVSFAALRLGRPVKWTQDRYDDLLTSAQARDHRYRVEVGFDADGVVLSLDAEVLVDVGGYAMLPFGSSLEANGAPRNMPGPYRLGAFRYRTRAVATHTCPTGAYRGVSAPLACLAVEGLMDRIARHRGLDPAEVRRRNLVRDFPYQNVLGQTYADGCFLPALERALDRIAYAALRRRDPVDGHRRRGVGIAVITEQTGMGASRYKARGLLRVPGYESASVKLEPDGTVVAGISQAAQGQGHATAFAQIVSDRLGAPLDDIRIIEGDTARTPFGTGTFASRGIVIAGTALSRAAVEVREKMARIAAHLLECSAADLRFADGRAFVDGVPALSVGLREIAEVAYSARDRSLPAGESYGLEAVVYHDTPTAVIASAVHVAAVSVDLRSGRVAIERYVVVHDTGLMVNPTLVDGQVQGAVVQGVGEVLMEQITHDAAGQPQVVSLMEYQIPRSLDLAAIEIEAMHSSEGGGIFKGVGESGIIGSVPALANAVGDALAGCGVTVDRLPLTAEALYHLIHAARAR